MNERDKAIVGVHAHVMYVWCLGAYAEAKSRAEEDVIVTNYTETLHKVIHRMNLVALAHMQAQATETNAMVANGLGKYQWWTDLTVTSRN